MKQLRNMTAKEIFNDCFKKGDTIFYILSPITFPMAFLFFLAGWLGGMAEELEISPLSAERE